MRLLVLIGLVVLLALALAGQAGAWPKDRPHPHFPESAVVSESVSVWAADGVPGRTVQVATACSMSLGGVYKSAPWVWGSGAASCTWNILRVSLQLCLYRTQWLSLMGCTQSSKNGTNVSTSIQKDCRAGTQRYYMSGQATSCSYSACVVGPLGWVGGQTYTCS